MTVMDFMHVCEMFQAFDSELRGFLALETRCQNQSKRKEGAETCMNYSSA